MHYITDYQLDINKGFMCKVNGKPFRCEFLTTEVLGKHFYVSNILKVADAMGVPRYEFIGIFNSEHVNHVIYCDSRQQCYDLCQHIVNTYFKPTENWRDIINFRCGNESYKFELTVLAGKFMWRNAYDDSTPLINKSQVDIQKVKEELSIKIYTLAHCDSFGFDSREDALKFAKWVKENFYDKQEVCEKSREQLKHYYHGTDQVNFPNKTFILKQFRAREYFWSGSNPNIGSKDLYKQFELSTDQTLKICDKLKLHAYFCSNTLLFGSRVDAIKFTDYLIETYIIKKKKIMTRINYAKKELLSAEELNQQEVSYMVDEAKLQFDADVLNTKRALATKKAELEEAKTSYPINTQAIINLQIEVEAYQDGLDRLEKLRVELGF